ncbi:hypothetical protein DL93DRAFT_2092426 [Clavulina sp. PMI_390]|nr:hypothetical protein DL93DRAFT_2092426 [Clavulina sp. PMI_390]
MPLFGLIPKKNKSTPVLQQQVYDNEPPVSSSRSAAPGPSARPRHGHRASVSSVPDALTHPLYDATPSRSRIRQPPGTSSSKPLPVSPTRTTRLDGMNTSPPSNRTGASRPSLDNLGVRRVPNSPNGSIPSPRDPSSSSTSNPTASSSSYLGSELESSFGGSTFYNDDAPRGSSSTGLDAPLQPPSRSAIFGSGGASSDPRSQLSTQSLPEPPAASSRAANNNKPQRPSLATRQPPPRSPGSISSDYDDLEPDRAKWSGSQMSHSNLSTAEPGAPSKSKVLGWFSFRSSKSANNTPQKEKSGSRPPLPTSLPPPNGDIADRVRRLPLNPPDSPSPRSPSSRGLAPQQQPSRGMSTSTSLSLSSSELMPSSPEALSDPSSVLDQNDSTFKVRNFRHVSPATPPPSYPTPQKKRTKSISSFTTNASSSNNAKSTSSATPVSPSPKLSLKPGANASSSSLLDDGALAPPARPRSRNDSLGSETGRVTAAAFRQATQARRMSQSGSGSPLLMAAGSRTSVDSLSLLPPTILTGHSRSGTPTSTSSFRGISPMLGPGSPGDVESPASSSRTFLPGHKRTGTSDSIGSAAGAGAGPSSSNFKSTTALLNASATSSGNGNGGDLKRQDTITQRSVSSSVLPSMNNQQQNARGRSATNSTSPAGGSGSSRLPPVSPSAGLAAARSTDSPTSPNTGAGALTQPPPRTSSRVGATSSSPAQRGPGANPPPRSQSALGSYSRSPASRSSPNFGTGASSARPSTVVALSKPDVDSDTSESESEHSSDSSEDEDAPLAPIPRPGTSMSTRTTATTTRRSVPLNISAENVGKSGLPRPSLSSAGLPLPPRSSTLPVSPAMRSLGSGPISPASTNSSSFKPRQPAASRSADALNLPDPTSPPANAGRPSSTATATLLEKREQRLQELDKKSPNPRANLAQQQQQRRPFHQNSLYSDSAESSSIGDSSSGKLPVTPRDGSELGWQGAAARAAAASFAATQAQAQGRRSGDAQSTITATATSPTGAGRAMSGAASVSVQSSAAETVKGHVKRPSVSFDMGDVPKEAKELRGILKEPSSADANEIQRRERRRSEAKAAIEGMNFFQLGNIVNGPPPEVDVDSDMLSRFPQQQQAQQQQQQQQFGLGVPSNWDQWRTSQFGFNGMQMQSPQVPVANPMAMMMPQPPPNADPAFLAAHEQAMMIAKQTYQMAVAQQALAAANDEWERGSTATGFTRTGGGGAPPSIYGMPGMGMNMMGMSPMMGMPMMMPSMFPAAPASMYAGGGGSIAGSTMGGPAGWGSASVYGGGFGDRPSASRRSTAANGLSDSASVSGGLNRPTRPRTKTSPSGAPGAQTAAGAANRSNGGGRNMAPTSWKHS